MRNILTYEFLIRLHKDTIWNKRHFFLNSHVHTIRGKINIKRAEYNACVREEDLVCTRRISDSNRKRGRAEVHDTARRQPPIVAHTHRGRCAHTHVACTTQDTLSFPPSSLPTNYTTMSLRNVCY